MPQCCWLPAIVNENKPTLLILHISLVIIISSSIHLLHQAAAEHNTNEKMHKNKP